MVHHQVLAKEVHVCNSSTISVGLEPCRVPVHKGEVGHREVQPQGSLQQDHRGVEHLLVFVNALGLVPHRVLVHQGEVGSREVPHQQGSLHQEVPGVGQLLVPINVDQVQSSELNLVGQHDKTFS